MATDPTSAEATLRPFVRDFLKQEALSPAHCTALRALAAPATPSAPLPLSADLHIADPAACTAIRAAFLSRHLPKIAFLKKLFLFPPSPTLSALLNDIVDAQTPGPAALNLLLSFRLLLTGTSPLPAAARPLALACLERQIYRRHIVAALAASATPLYGSELRLAVTALVSLPTVAANALEGRVPPRFRPAAFLRALAPQLLPPASTDGAFSGSLLGRLCHAGYGAPLWRRLLALPSSQQDSLRRLLSHHLLPEHADATLRTLVEARPPPAQLQLLLSDVSAMEVERLVRHVVLRNQRGVNSRDARLARSSLAFAAATRPDLLRQLFNLLLRQWTFAGAIQGPNACCDRHEAVSATLLTATHLVQTSAQPLTAEEKSEALALLLPAISLHLGATDDAMRRLGMIVSEHLMAPSCLGVAPPNEDGGVNELRFEYEEDDTSRALKALAGGKEVEEEEADIAALFEEEEEEKEEEEKEKKEEEEELDSDDLEEGEDDNDLRPYDLSADVPVGRCAPPKFLRQCLEGLRSSRPEDQDRLEACVAAGESLIRSHPSAARDCALEMGRALLHLAPDCPDPQAMARRRVAMLAALAEAAPLPMASFLTSAFYEPNFSIPQRLDILAAITEAAQRLSALRPLDRKAAPRRPVAASAPCRFAPVAGAFFFPLMAAFDRPVGILDLRRDLLVLARLLLTLAIVLSCAEAAPGQAGMKAALLELLSDAGLERHSDPAVRRASFCGLAAILGSGPVPLLQLRPELAPRVAATRSFLAERAREDPDGECRQMAAWGLAMLRSRCAALEGPL